MANLCYVIGGPGVANHEKPSVDAFLRTLTSFGRRAQEGDTSSRQGTIDSSENSRLSAEARSLCEQSAASDAHRHHMHIQPRPI